MITAKQIRAARAYLFWTEAKLAQMSKLSIAAIQRVERMDDAPVAEVSAVRRALEAAGIVFSDGGICERRR